MLNTIGEFWNNPLLLAQTGLILSTIGSISLAFEIFGIERIKRTIESALMLVRVSSIFFIRDPILENPRLKISRMIIASYMFLGVGYVVVNSLKIKNNPELVTFLLVLFFLFFLIPIFYATVAKLLEKAYEKPTFVFGWVGIIFIIIGFFLQYRVNILTLQKNV